MILRPQHTTLIVVVGACLWGLFWLPLRRFEAMGLSAAWATLAQFAVPVLLLTPVAIWLVRHGRASGLRGEAANGLLIGGAFAFYAESLLLTEVARALILFYVTPVWGTILERIFMGRRFTPVRGLALVLGLAGLFVILGGKTGIPLPQNLGDAMALLSGMLWAVGSLRLRQGAEDTPVFESIFAFFVYGGLVALVLALLPTFLPLESLGAPPSWATVKAAAPWLLLCAAGFLIPVMWSLLWGARHMDPGRLGILLQLEVIIGIASAAALTEEPFGLIEALGALLVVGAGLAEVLGDRKSQAGRP